MTIGFLFGIYGVILGSFYNVLGMRCFEEKIWERERSFCSFCQNNLRWFELLPLLSFVIQGGKCNHCKNRLSIIYPVIEGITGLFFYLSWLKWGISAELLFVISLGSVLIVLSVSDLVHLKISNIYLLGSSLLLIPLYLFFNEYHLFNIFNSVLFTAIFFTILLSIFPGKMGMGDVKLFFMLSVFFSIYQLLFIYLISSLIAIVCFVIALLLNSKLRKIPFVPFISIATIIVMFVDIPKILLI